MATQTHAIIAPTHSLLHDETLEASCQCPTCAADHTDHSCKLQDCGRCPHFESCADFDLQ